MLLLVAAEIYGVEGLASIAGAMFSSYVVHAIPLFFV